MQLRSAGYYVSMEDKRFRYLEKFLRTAAYPRILVFCDSNTRRNCLPFLQGAVKQLRAAPVHVMPAGERHKTLEQAEKCWDFLLAQGADRSTLLVCVGGGVVCDLGGFAASTFKRGIPFIHIPTTLLAMADASVGGKTGIDFRSYKNLVGTITQPAGVFINPGFLRTLSPRHLRNGMAEIIKAALIGSQALWNKLKEAGHFTPDMTDALIEASVKVKNKIVSRDPLERNVRKLLNFGHTAGHAIESYYLGKKNEVLHGEAIAMGMCVELCLGTLLRRTQAQAEEGILSFFKKHYKLRPFPAKEITALIRLMQHDKKNRNGRLNFTLVEKPGAASINNEATEAMVRRAFQRYNEFLKSPGKHDFA
jgi:3-dehydroquinate synthase